MAATVSVLYVDDDPGLGILLGRALKPYDYIVETVETGDAALARLTESHFDLVALDHNLTNEVGIDIIPRIRALPQPPPIIYVTGSEDVRIAVAALKAGAVDYVWKDVQGHYRELLRQAIDTAIAQERMKRQSEEAQRQIVEARDRAEMLLKEVNHRVANSLAIVSSFVQMGAHALTDPMARDMMRDTQARIGAIVGVHRRLYTSADVRSVEINPYLQSLVEELSMTMGLEGGRLRFIPADCDIAIPTDKAVSLGVVITELVTNAHKYAYGDGGRGEVRVLAKLADAGQLKILVEDDGVGWTGTGRILGSGVGSRIIKAMAQSLQAELHYDSDAGRRGTRAELSFPI
jgi:two-component sensor histidine kinase